MEDSHREQRKKTDPLPAKATSEEPRSDPNSTRQNKTRKREKGCIDRYYWQTGEAFALARPSLAGSFSLSLSHMHAHMRRWTGIASVSAG
jgi:hypothetical protein